MIQQEKGLTPRQRKFLKRGQLCRVRVSFKGEKPFERKEQYVFLGTFADTETGGNVLGYYARFRTLDGKANTLNLPSNKISSAYLEPLSERVNPDEFIPSFPEPGNGRALEAFAIQGEEFYVGEMLKFERYALDLVKKEITLLCKHDKKNCSFVFPFRNAQGKSDENMDEFFMHFEPKA